MSVTINTVDSPVDLSQSRFDIALGLWSELCEAHVIFRLFSSSTDEDAGYFVVLPQAFDQALAVCT